VYTRMHSSILECILVMYSIVYTKTKIHSSASSIDQSMGWLRLIGSLKL